MQPQGQCLLRSVDTYYSPVFGPVIFQSGNEQVDWIDLMQRIKLMPFSEVIRLQPLEPDGQFVTEMERALRLAGYAVDRFFCFGNWYQSTHGQTFEAYWSQRPSRLRNTVERARRRLGRVHTWRVEVLTQPGPDLEQAIDAFNAVYARSWKQPEPCPDFIPALVRMAAGMGALRLGQLWLEGRVVASQVWLVYGGKASIYKLAYVPGYEKLSLGSVLTAALMQHVLDCDKVVEVDYLMGDDVYKQDWVSSRRERIGLVAFRTRHPLGFCAWVKHRVGRWLRRATWQA